ncbi:MAG: thermonuclease family protein [Bacillota bacterium]
MNKKYFLLMLSLLLILNLSNISTANTTDSNAKLNQSQLNELQKVYINRVIDGDTVETKSGQKIRLIGVDTPELDSIRETVQHQAKKAYHYTKKELTNQTAYLEFDVERLDQYKRTLAYLYLPDGQLFNNQLVKAGYAYLLTIPPNLKYVDLFKQSLNKARRQKRGLWQKNTSKQLPIISWSEAQEYLDQPVVVKGKIDNTHNSGDAIFLNFSSNYQDTLTAVIFSRYQANFPAQPADYYLNKQVKIRGKITEYQNAPQIILKSQKQITTTN